MLIWPKYNIFIRWAYNIKPSINCDTYVDFCCLAKVILTKRNTYNTVDIIS